MVMDENAKFTFSNLSNFLQQNDFVNEEVIIVSIIGKTPFDEEGLKVKTIGPMFAYNSLRGEDKCTIEGYYDVNERIIYLHVHSLLDTDNFLMHYEELAKEYQEKQQNDDFLLIFDEIRSSFAKVLFLLFHLSHIVVISHPEPCFDTNYVQYFKSVESVSKKVLEKICSDLGQDETMGEEWIANGRFATPRIIFYFEKPPRNVSNIKKFEHNLEDRIYQILRKNRVIGNRNWSLFTVPLNEEFVFVSTEKPFDAMAFAVNGLIKDCQTGIEELEPPFYDESEDLASFQNFLRRHISQARNNGFDDCASHFELPKLSNWVTASEIIYETLKETTTIKELCVESRFSEQRCRKVLPMAMARYQEGLTGAYTTAVHETRLRFALALFCAQARGPMFQKYHDQLENDCNNYWHNGRQLCEYLSLKGNPCTMPKDHSDDQEHNSGILYIAVCDCGRKPGSREDPYKVKPSNYDFYHQLSKECGCFKSERIKFPTFTPSVENYKAAALDPELENAKPRVESVFALSKEKIVYNTEEYLPSMLTLNSPTGFLPEFQSWSLVCYGASSLYSHNMGLLESHQPGFWPNTNYLLPWDVQVQQKSFFPHRQQENDEQDHHKHRQKDGKGKFQPFTVKIFIGFEYECPRGHRFMLATNDRVLKASPGSLVKDKGQKVAESDMPLFFACPCGRGTITIMAQLMRIHAVTPKAAVHVKMNPKVQPEPNGPIFIPTQEGPSVLTQAAYWILRLPYIYYSDKKNYLEVTNGRVLAGVFSVKKIDTRAEYSKEKHGGR